MIVKDEAHVIARCLDSLRPLIDGAVIVDTGSTDGTQAIVRDYFARHSIDGDVIEQPWRDFAHNRSAALDALRRRAGLDYALVMDADDSLAFEPGFDAARFKAGLDADMYDVAIHHGGTVYRRPQLFRNADGYRYRSVLHEYLEGPPGDLRRVPAAGFHIVYGADGGRSRDPDKYRKDAAVLERALEPETDPFLRARYTFYLAQSYRDSGQRRPAIAAYLRRAELGHWEQEVFESLLNAGKMMAEEGETTDAVLGVLDRASAAVPGRAEADQSAARICRERGEHGRGLAAATRGVALPQPESGLFLQPWVYDVGLLDEYAVNASWVGRDMDALVAWSIILGRPELDPGTRTRVLGNRDFVHDRLKAQNSLWTGTLGEDRAPRIAVVTPYHGETPETLRRCVDSVKRQTVRTDHILVADGKPQDWLDGEVARHLRNDRASRDAGDTPRALGALLAASAGYAAICFLDADCWYEPDHVELCLRSALGAGLDACGIVTTSRTIRRTDLSAMPMSDEDSEEFADTNCYCFLPASFGLLATWGLWPRRISPVGDRLFFRVAASSGLPRARTRRATVNYVTTWAAHYRALGEPPPLPLKENPDHGAIRTWIEAMPAAGIETLRRQIGVDVRGLYDPTFRAVAGGEPWPATSAAAPSTSPAIEEAERLFAQGKVAQAQTKLRSTGYDERTKARYAAAMCRIVRARRDFGPPSLVWRCDDRSLFEIDWIRELLKDVDYVDAVEATDDPKNAHLIVCDNRLTPEKRDFYIDRAARGSRIHLIHLSDEWASDDTACYDVCATVFRNQWSPAYDDLKHVVTFPLGYKRGYRVHPADRASAERPFLWSFAGHTRSDARQAMLRALEGTKPHRTHLSSGFDAADGLAQDDYRRLMEQSLFAPCPSGFSTPDTFRFCEALEAGCIPIVERGAECDYYRSWLGQHPALVINDWSEASTSIERVLAFGDAERVRQVCLSWWDASKRSYQELFAARIAGKHSSRTPSIPNSPRPSSGVTPEHIAMDVADKRHETPCSPNPPASDTVPLPKETNMSVTYNGLRSASSAEHPHLGGNVTVGDPYTFCPSVWDYVITRFGIESALDIGSGTGNASHFFFKRGLKTLAVEGLEINVGASLYPTIRVDLTKTKAFTRVDLVHCQEVVEHIDEKHIDNLLGSLLSGRIILMTHAVPGQIGHHHVNCQPAEYWIDHMARVDCDFLEGDTARIRELARKDGAPYMANTGMLFFNRTRT
ncbi:glycosyltransferase [Lichenibacterium dinghuense]|uniref:glycosyltransferase n=1 Tax=Lichenibacterium dinghuense TaxID=2895977 RepID=UPI001F1F977E|nr:glycosyltransferase [Lichenibacterium sp. 6Y81]